MVFFLIMSIMKNTDWIRIRNRTRKVIINYQTHILCYIAARKLENDNQLTIDRPLRTKNMKFFHICVIKMFHNHHRHHVTYFFSTCTYEFLMNNAKKRKKLKMYEKKNLSKKHSTVPSTQYKTWIMMKLCGLCVKLSDWFHMCYVCEEGIE
jgi:hypothetical protein